MLAIVIATVPVVASLHASTFAALRSQMCLPASTFELPSYILRNYLSSGAATLQIHTQMQIHQQRPQIQICAHSQLQSQKRTQVKFFVGGFPGES